MVIAEEALKREMSAVGLEFLAIRTEMNFTSSI